MSQNPGGDRERERDEKRKKTKRRTSVPEKGGAFQGDELDDAVRDVFWAGGCGSRRENETCGVRKTCERRKKTKPGTRTEGATTREPYVAQGSVPKLLWGHIV